MSCLVWQRYLSIMDVRLLTSVTFLRKLWLFQVAKSPYVPLEVLSVVNCPPPHAYQICRVFLPPSCSWGHMVWVLMLHAGTRLCFLGNTMQPFISRLGNKPQEGDNTAGKELVSKQHPQQELRPPSVRKLGKMWDLKLRLMGSSVTLQH